MYKILVIEDDRAITEAIINYLNRWDLATHSIVDFHNVYQEFLAYQPDLILLDISLPFYNGFYWCQMIREQSAVPIIFISSATDNLNIIMAMNTGADDFITKPFDLSVLHAKITALLRRTYDFNTVTALLADKDLVLNLNNTTLTYQGTVIDLTKNEFKIMQLLLQHKGQILSREDIMRFLWDNESFIDDNTLTVNITRLRRKLESYHIFDYIKTKKGIGYYIS